MKIGLLILFLISGILSGIAYDSSFRDAFYLAATLPGLIFGIFFSIAHSNKFINKKSHLLFLLISTISFSIAYLCAYFGSLFLLFAFWGSTGGNSAINWIPTFIVYFIAGLIGAKLLSVGTSYYIEKIERTKNIVITGGIAAGIAEYLTHIFIPHQHFFGYIPEFILWQVAVGLILSNSLSTTPIVINEQKGNQKKFVNLISIILLIFVSYSSYLARIHLNNTRAINNQYNQFYDRSTDKSLTQFNGWLEGNDPTWILAEATLDYSGYTGKKLPLKFETNTQCSYFDERGGSSMCLTEYAKMWYIWGDGDVVRIFGREVNNELIVKKIEIISKLYPDKVKPTSNIISPTKQVDTAGWKKYTNSQYQFEFTHPPDFASVGLFSKYITVLRDKKGNSFEIWLEPTGSRICHGVVREKASLDSLEVTDSGWQQIASSSSTLLRYVCIESKKMEVMMISSPEKQEIMNYIISSLKFSD